MECIHRPKNSREQQKRIRGTYLIICDKICSASFRSSVLDNVQQRTIIVCYNNNKNNENYNNKLPEQLDNFC